MELAFTNLLIVVAIGFAAPLALGVLMQATSLPFIVASTAVGLALDVVTPANAAALVAAGLLSVVIFPAVSLVLLRRDPKCARAIEAAMAERRAGTVGTMHPVGDDRVVAAPGA